MILPEGGKALLWEGGSGTGRIGQCGQKADTELPGSSLAFGDPAAGGVAFTRGAHLDSLQGLVGGCL